MWGGGGKIEGLYFSPSKVLIIYALLPDQVGQHTVILRLQLDKQTQHFDPVIN